MKNAQAGLILGQSVVVAVLGIAVGFLVTQKRGSAAAQMPLVVAARPVAAVPAPATAPAAEEAEAGASAETVRMLTQKLDSFMEDLQRAKAEARAEAEARAKAQSSWASTVEKYGRQPGLYRTLQTLRSQIELYKIQHADNPPPTGALWTQMTHATNTTGATIEGRTTRAFSMGPYVQAPTVNPVNGQSGEGSKPSPKVGWVYTVNGSEYTIQAVNAAGDGVLDY
jgi:hypothetical protein